MGSWGVPESEGDGVELVGVYFVQGVDGGPIKIGRSYDPIKRMAALQSASPVQLRMLFTARCGDLDLDESALHARFAQYRLHGEWFEPAPEILAYIEELKKKLSQSLAYDAIRDAHRS